MQERKKHCNTSETGATSVDFPIREEGVRDRGAAVWSGVGHVSDGRWRWYKVLAYFRARYFWCLEHQTVPFFVYSSQHLLRGVPFS